MIEELMELFSGLPRAHGVYRVGTTPDSRGKVGGRAQTVLEQVTEKTWQEHIEGKAGLGIIPIRDDATCVFGAIDIDDYQLDLEALGEAKKNLGLPLVLCRTKSGGAHLYLFLVEPVSAEIVRNKLVEFAVALGYPGVEVFPKQTALASSRDVGNWINMPYFDHEVTTRYAMQNGHPLMLHEFIQLARDTAVNLEQLLAIQPRVSAQFDDGPPCLQQLATHGFPQGSRNNGLFNIGVYLRLKYPDDWEKHVEEFNQKKMKPPLSSGEVQTTIKSLKRKNYFYMCSQQPISQVCNRELCLTRKYGIGNDENEEGPDVVIGSLTKIITRTSDGRETADRPVWVIDVDGVRLELGTEDFLQQERFRKVCMERINKLPKRQKANRWEKMISDKLSNVDIVEAPPDAGPEGQFWQHLEAFCTEFSQAQSEDELLLGKPFTKDGTTYFRSPDLFKYLDQQHFRDFKQNQIWRILRNRGAVHHQFNVKGKCVQCWGVKSFAEQDEPFSVNRVKPEF